MQNITREIYTSTFSNSNPSKPQNVMSNKELEENYNESPFFLDMLNPKNLTLDNTTNPNNPYEDVDATDYCVPCIIINILLISCVIAMCVNIIVIVSVYWIRSPMTPNLKISLSLAAADACSSSMYGLFLFLEEYVPGDLGVMPYVIELFRLSGIVITVIHLLALSINHYIGIMKPLHYNSIVTNKKVATVISLLWICPTLIVVSLCAAFDTDRTLLHNLINNVGDQPKFMETFAFRVSFSSLFFIPIFVMVFCYTHILLIVRRQQNRWMSRVGSSRSKGRSLNACNSNGSQKINKEQKQLEGNVRAIYTTLLILGSCFIGWTPALMFYVLACPVGCLIQGEELTNLNANHRNLVAVLRLIDNILVIMKMLANPVIYSIRMREIKDGTRRMCMAISGLFCPSRRRRSGTLSHQRSRLLHNSIGTGTVQVRMTSFKVNGNKSQVSIGRGDINNTFL